jgi:glycosyltransferase involved in cell wall biosynthesis
VAASRQTSRVLVSVVIPVLDDGPALARCLAALARQTRLADEIVVVDNGCSDDTAAVAERAGTRVVREPRAGIPAANATGLDAARGDILARLDADSVPPETWLADLVAAFADPSVAGVTGPGAFYDGPRLLRRPLAAVYLGSYRWTVTLALASTPLFGSNCALRSDAWRAVSGRVHRGDAEVHDDMDVSVHLGPGRRVVFHPELVVGISMRPFADAAALRIRAARGFRTLAVHGVLAFPPYRWAWRAAAAVTRRD